MSLTGWFRDYLYIPLGGNRCGAAKTVRNIFIVWFCTGFWHGASWNFVIWGLYFFCWLMLEKYLLRNVLEHTHSAVKHLYTVIVVFVGWGIFAMEDLGVCRRVFEGVLRRRGALERGGLVPSAQLRRAVYRADSGIHHVGPGRLAASAQAGAAGAHAGFDGAEPGALHGVSGGRKL